VHWWDDDPTQNLFMEITTRTDIGSYLKAPKAARGGQATPGSALVDLVKPGDVVVHYSSTAEAILGTSAVAGEPKPGDCCTLGSRRPISKTVFAPA
jgi:hypothetical protein